ncbi:hypothetical protein JCM8097_005536 [Rhodosporidiobolus ruineniae]
MAPPAAAPPGFPAEEDTFPTLRKFKIHCLEAGYLTDTDLQFEHSIRSWTYRCAIPRSGADPSKASPAKALGACGFHLVASKVKPTGDAVLVSKTQYRHTCAKDVRGPPREKGKGKERKEEKAPVASSSSFASRPIKTAPSASPPKPASKPPVQKKAVATVLELDSSSSEDEGSTVSKDRAANPFPSASSLKPAVDRYLEHHPGPVHLPSPDLSFPTVHALFTHLHAHARSRSFTLYRRGSSSKPDQTRLVCSKARKAGLKDGEKECGFAVKAKRGEDGAWRVVKVTAEHSHPVGGGGTSGRSTPLEVFNSAAASSSLATSTSAAAPSPPPPYDAPPALRSTTPSTTPPDPALAATAVPASAEPDIYLRPPAPPPSLPDFSTALPAFLASLSLSASPPSPSLTDLFLSLGLSSADDLAALALMDDHTLGLMLELVQGRVGEEAAREVGGVLGRMRQVMAGGV